MSCQRNCLFCTFANYQPGIPASCEEPAEPGIYEYTITGELYDENLLPEDCPEFVLMQELTPIRVSDAYV